MNPIASDKPLTPKQARFVSEYLIDLNASAAAVRAGYTATNANVTGPRLLANVGIAYAVGLAKAKRADSTEITAEWVLARLRENLLRAMELDNASAANRALELLGKHVGLFGDKLDITVRAVTELSDAELDARRKALRLVA
jgi:phage terminase small subunit